MFIITEWFERYEVNDKGQPARDGDKLRTSSLVYIRSKVHGHSQSAGFHAMQRVAGPLAYQVFGVFQKFLEIAGHSGAKTRGILLNHRGRPATVPDLAHILRDKEKVVNHALQVLTNIEVMWMTQIDDTVFQEFQESQENWSAFLNSTQLSTTQHSTAQLKETIPGKSGKDVFSLEFENQFWPNVPHKLGTGKALEAYIKARKKVSAETICNGLPKYQAYEDSRKGQSDYRPLHPATWLNQERWADEVAGKETPEETVERLKAQGLL